jgi:hypothetical protein
VDQILPGCSCECRGFEDADHVDMRGYAVLGILDSYQAGDDITPVSALSDCHDVSPILSHLCSEITHHICRSPA